LLLFPVAVAIANVVATFLFFHLLLPFLLILPTTKFVTFVVVMITTTTKDEKVKINKKIEA